MFTTQDILSLRAQGPVTAHPGCWDR